MLGDQLPGLVIAVPASPLLDPDVIPRCGGSARYVQAFAGALDNQLVVTASRRLQFPFLVASARVRPLNDRSAVRTRIPIYIQRHTAIHRLHFVGSIPRGNEEPSLILGTRAVPLLDNCPSAPRIVSHIEAFPAVLRDHLQGRCAREQRNRRLKARLADGGRYSRALLD